MANDRSRMLTRAILSICTDKLKVCILRIEGDADTVITIHEDRIPEMKKIFGEAFIVLDEYEERFMNGSERIRSYA